MRQRPDRRIRRLDPITHKSIIKKLIPIIKEGVYTKQKIFIYPANIELTEFIRKEFTKYAETNKEERR